VLRRRIVCVFYKQEKEMSTSIDQTSLVSTRDLAKPKFGYAKEICCYARLRYVDVQPDFLTMIYTYRKDMYEARLYWLGHTKLPMVSAFRTSLRAPYTKKPVILEGTCASLRAICHFATRGYVITDDPLDRLSFFLPMQRTGTFASFNKGCMHCFKAEAGGFNLLFRGK
jgi:hypothetical protein